MMPASTASAPHIRDVRDSDAARLVAIYNHYVAHTTVTFEEAPVSVAEFAQRIAAVQTAGLPYLVVECDGVVLGYAYASRWKDRIGYRCSVESTVYLEAGAGGRGLGALVYSALLDALQGRGVHAVMGGIALPNEASVALHEKLGMAKVAHFIDAGCKFGEWIDVGYWQRIFPTTAPAATLSST
jgi:L-amino acid N-acyltransferase YncA